MRFGYYVISATILKHNPYYFYKIYYNARTHNNATVVL